MEAYAYFKDFGVSLADYNKCIEKVATDTKQSQEKVVAALLKHLENITINCINKTAKANKALKDYQKLAVRHMLTHRGMIAAFDVGTGKTLTAVAVANCLLQIAKFLNIPFEVIVVTPTSLQDNFKKELKAVGVTPGKDFIFYTTTLFTKAVLKGELDCSQKLVIIDESHVFRTDYRGAFGTIGIEKTDTRAEMAVKCAANASKVLLLTATPIYNKTHDIINLVSMVKGVYPPFDVDPLSLYETNPQLFRNQYCDAILFQKSSVEDFPRREDILYKIQMEGDYEKEYRELLTAIKERSDFKGEKAKNAFMTKVRTASNNMSSCIKCDHAMQIINNALKSKERVLLFSEFKSNGVELMIDNLKKAGIGYYLIDGTTAKKKRQQYVNEFNSDNGEKVIIITKAGGEGLDLKKVMHVILFEKGWNISGQEQVVGRAIRYRSHADLPESKRVVKVWHLVTLLPEEFNTLDIPELSNYQVINKRNKIYTQVVKDSNVVFMPVSKTYSILKNNQNITIPNSLGQYFMFKFPNRLRPYIGELLKENDITFGDALDQDINSADAYMFKQSITKEANNSKLANALQEIQIGVVACDIEETDAPSNQSNEKWILLRTYLGDGTLTRILAITDTLKQAIVELLAYSEEKDEIKDFKMDAFWKTYNEDTSLMDKFLQEPEVINDVTDGRFEIIELSKFDKDHYDWLSQHLEQAKSMIKKN